MPTKLDRFCRDGTTLLTGQAAIDFYRGTGTCMGGYLAVADEINAEVVVPVCASAPPSGPVDSEAYETFCRMITDAVAQGGFDALWLDLHGAMVTERFDDGEGELLRRIRAIDPHTPLCVAYDMHANVFDAMVANAQIVTGYQTYPHIDQRQTAERAARALLRVMRRRGDAHRRLGQRADAAARDGAGHAPGAEQGPAGDVRGVGGKRPRARRQPVRRLPACRRARWPGCPRWLSPTTIRTPHRRWWTNCSAPPGRRGASSCSTSSRWKRRCAAPRTLGAPGQLPVVLLDHYDNCASGGTMDTTDTLREIIRQDLDDVVFFGIYDPDAVRAGGRGGRWRDGYAVDRGEAADAAIAGGQRAADGDRRGADDLVRRFRLKGGLTPGLQIYMGRTVVLDTGKVQIVLLSRHIEPTAQEMLQVLGIDPSRKKYVAIKSRVHWRADLGKIAREIVECAGVGVCTSDYGQLTFRKVRRPVFPLDPDLQWNRPA